MRARIEPGVNALESFVREWLEQAATAHQQITDLTRELAQLAGQLRQDHTSSSQEQTIQLEELANQINRRLANTEREFVSGQVELARLVSNLDQRASNTAAWQTETAGQLEVCQLKLTGIADLLTQVIRQQGDLMSELSQMTQALNQSEALRQAQDEARRQASWWSRLTERG